MCHNETRYVAFSFKQFCKDHADEAAIAGGRLGGKAPAWNRGQTKESDSRIAALAKSISGPGNAFYGKKHTAETKQKNADYRRLPYPTVVSRILKRHRDIAVLSTEKDYISQESLLDVLCSTCDTRDAVSLFNLMRCWKCRKCFPNASAQQIEVADFITSLIPNDDVIISTRSIIPPLELDIWIPSKKLAIEYHGLFWHAGGKEGVFDKKRHREKYVACRDAGIRLIQLYSDEWLLKRLNCESILRHAVVSESIKLNARDCVVREISTDAAKKFLETSHMAGYTLCSRRFGLHHPVHGLVGVLTIRKPIQKKHGDNLAELARMAFASGVSVRGGVGKLLSAAKNALCKTYSGIISYAELRFGQGGAYENAGMTRLNDAVNNYWYTDGIVRFNRFKYRAQKPLTEKEVADHAGVRPVYGCGNAVYVMKW